MLGLLAAAVREPGFAYGKRHPGWSFADQPALKKAFFGEAHHVVIASKPVAGAIASLARRLHPKTRSRMHATLIMEQ
jgi:hypothetical protein